MVQLEDLLQECTVKLTIPGQPGWGTGFFVALDLILTCAHVVRKAEGQLVQVQWWNQKTWAQATVEKMLSDPHDLALLRVTLPIDANPSCVYLDEEVRSRDPLYLFGYPDEGDRQGEPRTFNCDGLTGSAVASILFNLGQVRPGMSGSPLLNQRTGKVCGIVKFTRDRSFDLGGGAIPVRVILEQFPQLRELQQQFHLFDQRWSNLVAKMSEPQTMNQDNFGGTNYQIQIGANNTNYIGETHIYNYVSSSSGRKFDSRTIDFQPYLRSIVDDDDYREWQDVYTTTTVEDSNRLHRVDAQLPQHRFSPRLKLRVETVKPQESEETPEVKTEAREQVEQLEVLEGLRKYAIDHVLLIGKPGSGKSTSLERLLWEEANNALNYPDARIPVLVKLRRCTATIEGLIRDFFSRHQLPIEEGEIEELLQQGKLLLLLDGLNELPESFATEIANFRDRYRSTTPMIVSTRDLGGGGNLGITKTLKMLPLTEPQMQEFARGYLGEQGDKLFQQLKGDRLRKFAETPLLLWMLCRVFVQNSQVPANLGLAFREFAQLHDQEIQQDAPTISRDQWHKLLRHLAFALMHGEQATEFRLSISREAAENLLTDCLQQEGRSNPRDCAERWLSDLLKYHLLQPVVQPNFEEHIEFRHQLIQEYYAAEYLLRMLPNLSDEQLKRDYLNYLKWTEPVALLLALIDQEMQALRIVRLALDIDLMLGARLAGEATPEFQTQTTAQINNLAVYELLKIKLLGATRSSSVIPDLLKALENPSYYVRRNAAEALGHINSKQTIAMLLKRALDDGDFYVRKSAAEALGHIDREQAVMRLLEILNDPNNFHRCHRAIEILGWIGGEQAVAVLRTLYDGSNYSMRRTASQALARIREKQRNDDLPTWLEQIGLKATVENMTLWRAIMDDELLLFMHGTLFQSDEQTVLESLEALNHHDPLVRRVKAKQLGRMGNSTLLPQLHQMLRTGKVELLDSIVAIQNRCKLYNYEIAQTVLDL